ncbi:MAG: 23S rRNA G2445 N2-methylase RlmL [Pirellulaceae bacterium]|jgi:23S rRNA G2445 N2-methylase RlmL
MALELIATAAFGLEAIVVRELRALGYEAKTIQPGRILFTGEEEAICQANIWLRSSDRLLIRVGNFEATDFGQLFDQTVDLPWERWLSSSDAFPVVGKSVGSQLHNVPTCQKMVKKAIVERLRKAHGVETLDETGPKHSVEVSVLKDEVTLSIDTTGEGLTRRGYRKMVGSAPLRETMAAAMIQLSYWNEKRLFLDPFCGTGTIPIEAAMIARNRAPGMHREFAAEHWPTVAPALWNKTREHARDVEKPRLARKLLASDIDPQAIELARYHARQAGVENDIEFKIRDFFEFRSGEAFGCLFANPPYGHRMGEGADVLEMYDHLPDVFSELEEWSYWILTAESNFEHIVGKEADRRRKLYNGRIQCTLYQYYGARPPREETPE